MFSIFLMLVRFLLTAGDLEFAASHSRVVSCAGAKGASDGGFSVAAVAAGGQHRSSPGGKFLAFQPLLLIYYSPLDPFPRGPVRRAF